MSRSHRGGGFDHGRSLLCHRRVAFCKGTIFIGRGVVFILGGADEEMKYDVEEMKYDDGEMNCDEMQRCRDADMQNEMLRSKTYTGYYREARWMPKAGQRRRGVSPCARAPDTLPPRPVTPHRVSARDTTALTLRCSSSSSAMQPRSPRIHVSLVISAAMIFRPATAQDGILTAAKHPFAPQPVISAP